MRALIAALLVTACVAGGPAPRATAPIGSADPVEHFLQVCGDLAPTPPGEFASATGWIERPRQLAEPDQTTTHILDRVWSKRGVERADTTWVSE